MQPLVEISFMPQLLASGNQTWSHYDANVTPPKDWNQWADFITAFIEHLVDRYTLEEILTWNFEMWNEPNLPDIFWVSTQEEYFNFFNITSYAVKRVHPDIRIGGPATGNYSII
jgi:xylan 1,4-beta-xylosidase